MTPAKKKADELVEKYLTEIHHFTGSHEPNTDTFAIRLSIIAVEEIIQLPVGFMDEGVFLATTTGYYAKRSFWQEVKQELINQQ